MKYFIKTTYPCIIKTNNQLSELNQDDILECEEESQLFVYPQKIGIPFCVNLNAKTDTEFYSFVTIKNQNFVVLEKPQNYKIFQIENLNISGKNCKIEIHQNSLAFETDTKKIEYKCNHDCTSYKTIKFKNFACIKFDKDVYAFSMKENKLYHFSGDKLSINKNEISVFKNFEDSQVRTKTTRYSLEDNIKILEENFSSNQENEYYPELSPYKFLECIKAQDFNCAEHFLTDNLKKTITATKLEKFFDALDNFLPLSPKEFLLICGKTKKYATFELENKKIADISVDDL